MKILLDECVPAPLQSLLTNHVCTTVQSRGWSGIKNGDLLLRAEAEFDLFITSDQNIRYQQNLSGRTIAILELSSNDIDRIRAVALRLHEAVANIQPNALERPGNSMKATSYFEPARTYNVELLCQSDPAARAGLPGISDAPRVRLVQRQQLQTALPWAARALGLPPPE